MLQKIQKKLQKLLKEKGQGIVEYALILGFVAVIAVILVSNGSLETTVKANIDNQNSVLKAMDSRFKSNAEVSTEAGKPKDNLTGETNAT